MRLLFVAIALAVVFTAQQAQRADALGLSLPSPVNPITPPANHAVAPPTQAIEPVPLAVATDPAQPVPATSSPTPTTPAATTATPLIQATAPITQPATTTTATPIIAPVAPVLARVAPVVAPIIAAVLARVAPAVAPIIAAVLARVAPAVAPIIAAVLAPVAPDAPAAAPIAAPGAPIIAPVVPIIAPVAPIASVVVPSVRTSHAADGTSPTVRLLPVSPKSPPVTTSARSSVVAAVPTSVVETAFRSPIVSTPIAIADNDFARTLRPASPSSPLPVMLLVPASSHALSPHDVPSSSGAGVTYPGRFAGFAVLGAIAVAACLLAERLRHAKAVRRQWSSGP
jgi:hypothetical protein